MIKQKKIHNQTKSESSVFDLVCSFETESELGSVPSEIPVGNDAVLTDTFQVDDSITSQLLQVKSARC